MDLKKFVKRLLLVDGRIDEVETNLIRRAILADHVVNRDEIEFLVELKREAKSTHPSFDEFLFKVLKRVVLKDGIIEDEQAEWLQKLIRSDSAVGDAERDFVLQLKSEAKHVGSGFQRLYDDVMKMEQTDVWG